MQTGRRCSVRVSAAWPMLLSVGRPCCGQRSERSGDTREFTVSLDRSPPRRSLSPQGATFKEAAMLDQPPLHAPLLPPRTDRASLPAVCFPSLGVFSMSAPLAAPYLSDPWRTQAHRRLLLTHFIAAGMMSPGAQLCPLPHAAASSTTGQWGEWNYRWVIFPRDVESSPFSSLPLTAWGRV